MTQLVTTINDLHREAQQWRNRALLAEARLATYEATVTARPEASAETPGETREEVR